MQSRFLQLVAVGLYLQAAGLTGAEPAGGKFLAPPIREWTYALMLHGHLGAHFDPYLVNSVMLGSSLTHGARPTRGKQEAVVLTLRTTASPANGEQPLELDESARKIFFGPAVTKTSFVIVDSARPLGENHPWNHKGQDKDGTYKPLLPFPQPVLALEIRGTMDMKGDDPWVLGELIAFVPADGKTPVDHLGWTSAPSPEPVVVPAGTFQNVFLSRRQRGDGRYAQRHTLESWVAEGVGLIKMVALDQTNQPIYTMQLVSYK